MTTKVVLYGRTSPTAERDEKERYGLASQISELRELASAKGYKVVGVYRDEDVSGKHLDRPGMDKIRELARAKAFDVLLVHDPDRLARKLALQLFLLDELDRNVKVEFKTTPREDSPEGRMLLNQKGVFAEYEREKIRERTMRGKREKAKRGLIPAGPVPFGYRQEAGVVVVHEPEAQIVRKCFRWLVDDQHSVRWITNELRRLGVRAARSSKWSRSSVRAMLALPVYTGQAHYEKTLIKVPAIVSPDLFERVSAQLKRNVQLWEGRPSKNFYLLRGLLVCGVCGRRYTSNIANQKRQYRCSGQDKLRTGHARCTARAIVADKLEGEIWEAVVGVLRQPDIMRQKMEAHQVTLGARDVEVKSAEAHLRQQLTEVEKQERKLLDLYLDDKVAADAVKARLDTTQQRKAGLVEQLAQVRQRIAQQQAEEARQEGIQQACTRALKGIDKLDNQGRHRLLATLVDKVVVQAQTGDYEIHGLIPALEPAVETGQSVWMIWPPLSSKLL